MAKKTTDEKPVLDRDFVESRVLEALERADNEVTLSKRHKAREEAKLLQAVLDASR